MYKHILFPLIFILTLPLFSAMLFAQNDKSSLKSSLNDSLKRLQEGLKKSEQNSTQNIVAEKEKKK
ncbi:MAG: hypothetical protein LBT89_04615 [Planctomycetaceae bacterium]|jgi:hypothetical protein|nr:hypothetical protein [Planctomycetaceae bacterium]